jgi:HAD superfamily hydrolase (TIGR01509 family)
MPDRAVLFDCDGVLVDSEPITNRVMRDDLARRGLDLPLDEVMGLFVGGTIDGAAQKARKLGADLPQNWVAYIYEQMFERLAEEVEVVPYAADLVDDLIAAGIKCAVGSNGPVRKMEITLGRTGLYDKFAPHIYSKEHVSHPKPAPDIYLYAAAKLGIAPTDCTVIEDSASGARAAKAAGMRCIGYVAEGQGDSLAAHCDHLIDDMRQAARLMGL